ncbi:hypothetical protein LCGC14_1124540 [marine sediment metagenome]|uniref:Uncharacterized protein n=1 Tax=marine sediment metagenome TaxID=412755 RepID=A0A0F9MQU9_9ZZZZ
MSTKKIGKVQSKRSKTTASQKRKKSIARIILISSFLTLIVGFIFAIIQFLGESFGFIPEIQLGTLSWGRSGDVIIIFVIGLLSSVFIGSFLVLFLMRNQMNK